MSVLVALSAAWCSPVLFSSDVYAYAAYGEMARLGLDPYVHASPHSRDQLVAAAQQQWVSAFPICLYGPGFVALAMLFVTAFGPLGTAAQLDAFRVAACVALLLCIPLSYAAFPGTRAARLRAAATIALNPAALWCAAEGHNDAIAFLVVLAGFTLVRRGRVSLGAALVALSATIKLPGIAAAAALATVDRRARIGAAVALAIAAILSLPLVKGIATQLAPSGAYAPQVSLQALFAPLGAGVAIAVALGACLLLAARGLALLRRGVTSGWIWLGLAGWVLIPNPYPWYGLWIVGLAALAPLSAAGRAAIWLSLIALLRYVPDAVVQPAPPLGAAMGLVATLPLVTLWYNERLS